MQRFEAYISVIDARDNRVKSIKLGFQVLIDEHQRLKRASRVAVT